MKLLFEPQGWADYLHWQAHDPKMMERVNTLLIDTMRSPFRGIGKPEPLREDWAGSWSRRINDEHRLIYRVMGKGDSQVLQIVQCRFHYTR